MNRSRESEDLLRRAARAYDSARLQALPRPEDCEHAFPEGFYESILREGERRHRVRVLWRRVAAAVLTLIIGGGALLAAIPSTRASIVTWVRQFSEGQAVYLFREDSCLTVLPEYELSFIPEGFYPARAIRSDTRDIVYYVNLDSEKTFVFEYLLVSKGDAIELLGQGEIRPEPVKVHGIPADFYRANDFSYDNHLIWFDEDGNIAFIVSSNLEKSVILRIAEGVALPEEETGE